MLLTNSAEGGTNTTTASTGNSGGASGNAWDGINIPANTTLTYSSTQAMHGTLSYHFTSATTASNFLRWDSQITAATTTTTLYARAYCYFNGTPPTMSRFIQFNDASATFLGGVGVKASGQFALRDSAAALVGSTTMSVPVSQWFRVELMLVSNATTGQLSLKVYSSPDSSVPDETLSLTNQNTAGGNIGQAVFGNPTAISGLDLYMDDLAVQDTGFVGSAVPSAIVSWIQDS